MISAKADGPLSAERRTRHAKCGYSAICPSTREIRREPSGRNGWKTAASSHQTEWRV